MARVFVIVLDSVGIGGAEDAADFGDEGADTLGHIAENMTDWHLPNLARLGLGHAAAHATGKRHGALYTENPIGAYAALREVSKGKDTPSGHWELAGVPVPWEWHYFPKNVPAWGEALYAEIMDATGEPFLANCHASGTEVIKDYGAEHIRTGHAIAYTSVDSVFQIAAHETHYGLARLYALCEKVATIVHPLRVGRVIARPFTGAQGAFQRTDNRRDFAITPPSDTMLDYVQKAGFETVGIGKIGDIFAQKGVGHVLKGGGDKGLVAHLEAQLDTAPGGSLVFANLVEFDSEYGHRRDVEGYARHLSWFDDCLGNMLPKLKKDDLLVITADHGNDPTWRGTDHTREMVPALFYSPDLAARDLGAGQFQDIAATVLSHLGVANTLAGRDLLA